MPQIKGKQIADAQITQAKLDLVDPTSALEAATKQYVDNATGGKISGSIADGEVAFGSGADNIAGDPKFTWDADASTLAVTGVGPALTLSSDVDGQFASFEASSHSLDFIDPLGSTSVALISAVNGFTAGDGGTNSTNITAGQVLVEQPGMTLSSTVTPAAVTLLDNVQQISISATAAQLSIKGDSGLPSPTTPTIVAKDADDSATTLNLSVGGLSVNGAPGSAGEVLTSQGAGLPPIWSANASGNIGGSIAANQLAFGSAADTIAGSSNLTFNSGTSALQLNGDATVNGTMSVVGTGHALSVSDPIDGEVFHVNPGVYEVSNTDPTDPSNRFTSMQPGQLTAYDTGNSAQLNGFNADLTLQASVAGGLTPSLIAVNDAAAAAALNLQIKALQLNGAAGSSGQVLTSQGASAAPIWTNPAASLPTGTTLRSYYVSKGGNDGTADGSVAKPFLTIQAAHDKALTDYPLSGATTAPIDIVISAGTYTENITITRQRTHFWAQSINPESKSVTIVGNVTVQCNSATQLANDPVSFKGILFAPSNASTSPAMLVSGTGAFSLIADGCYFYTTSTNVAAHAFSCTNTNASRARIILTNCSVQAVNAGPNAIDAQRGAWQIYNCRISYSASSGAGRPMYIANDATMYGGLSVVDSSNTISTVYAIGTMPAGSTTKVNLGYTAFVNSSSSGTGHGIQLATAGLVSLTASGFFSITNTAGTVYAVAGVAGSVACATGSVYATNATWQSTVTRSDITGDFAAGDLTGRYPSPTIANGAVTDAKVSATANIAQSKISGLTTSLSNKVTKTGDLMTGTLEFQTSGDSIKASNNSGQQYFSLNASTTKLKLLNTAGGSASTTIGYNSVIVDDAAGAVTTVSTGAITLETTGGLPPTPTLDTHVVTKKYVDDLVNGVAWKAPVKLVSTSNIATLSGTSATIDGKAIVAEDRVLLTAQGTATQNGIWVVKSGAWVRPSDFAAGASAVNAAMFIKDGNTYADTQWVCTSNTAVIGTDSLSFVQFGAGTTYTAGSGLQLIGGAFSVKLDGDSVSVSGSGTKAATLSSSGQEQTPSVTTGNYATTGLTLGTTPSGNGVCHVFVNGLRVSVGSGVRTKDSYFSNDGGTTAVTFANLASGDTLYWNGTIAGYDLDATDSVSFLYQDIV